MNGIKIFWVTSTSMLASEAIKSHTHDYYHLLYVKKGKFLFDLNGDTYTIKEGDIVLAVPGASHSIYGIKTGYIEIQEVKFAVSDPALGAYLLKLTDQPIRSESASIMLDNIISEYVTLGQQADESAVTYLHALLYLLTSEIRRSEQKLTGSEMIDMSGYPKTIRTILSYIEENYNMPISLDEIAEHVDLNKSYMCSHFKKNMSITIGEWINIVRTRKAAEMIIYSDLSLSQIAHNCGYVSTGHFIRVFQKHIGISPGQCRRAYPLGIHENIDKIEKRPNSLLYSVLAHKAIDPATILQSEISH